MLRVMRVSILITNSDGPWYCHHQQHSQHCCSSKSRSCVGSSWSWSWSQPQSWSSTPPSSWPCSSSLWSSQQQQQQQQQAVAAVVAANIDKHHSQLGRATWNNINSRGHQTKHEYHERHFEQRVQRGHPFLTSNPQQLEFYSATGQVVVERGSCSMCSS